MMKPAVFLDRDGTLIEEVGYIHKVEDLKVIDGTSKAIKQLNENGFITIIVTNQSGVARGYFEEKDVHNLNGALEDILKKDNAWFDKVYYCPHHIKGNIEKYTISCECRKPKAGLINQALKDFPNIDLSQSYVIGDKLIDVELGHNAGCKGILVKTGYGAQMIQDSDDNSVKPDFVAENVEEAISFILSEKIN